MNKKKQTTFQSQEYPVNINSRNIEIYNLSTEEIENILIKVCDETISKKRSNYSWIPSILFTTLITSLTADFKTILNIDLSILNIILPIISSILLLIYLIVFLYCNDKKYENETENKNKIVNKYLKEIVKKHSIKNNDIEYYE